MGGELKRWGIRWGTATSYQLPKCMILFMDDVVMVTEKKDNMQRNLDELKKVMDKWGMKMHWGKNESDDSEHDRRGV